MSEASGGRPHGAATSTTALWDSKVAQHECVAAARPDLAFEAVVLDAPDRLRQTLGATHHRLVLRPERSPTAGSALIHRGPGSIDDRLLETLWAGGGRVIAHRWVPGVPHFANAVVLDGELFLTDCWRCFVLEEGPRTLLTSVINVAAGAPLLGAIRPGLQAVATAAGLTDGPVHFELVVTEDGMRIVKFAARLAGEPLGTMCRELGMRGQAEAARVRSRAELAASVPPADVGFIADYSFVVRTPGVLRRVAGLDEIRARPCYHADLVMPQPGTALRRSDSGESPGATVVLRGRDEAAMLADIEYYQLRNAEGIFVVEEDTPRPAPRRVVLVDAYSSANRLAPLFAAAGSECVHVQSTEAIPAVYVRSFRAADFAANVVHRGDVEETLRAVAPHAPAHVLAGIESGVELADHLAEALGLPGNGTALSAARRDKHRMIETVRAAGLRCAGQLLTADLDELLAWRERSGGGRVVVKPVRSAGNDGVRFCDTAEDVAEAFRALLHTRDALAGRNDAVLGQEYLYGTEYYVNTVGRDGHHRVCDIWKTTHLSANGVRDLLDNAYLLPRRGEVQERLVPYVLRVLDALGIRNGPAHTELKLTPDGPCLIETGARVCGGDLPNIVRQAAGEGQLEWTVRAHLDPEAFLARRDEDYVLRGSAAVVNTVAPRSGVLRGYPRLAEVRALESFHGLRLLVAPGERITRTVDDFTKPLLVELMHEVEEVVIRDHLTIRQMDCPDFYDVE